ncbi:MAG: radical SAM protein [Candidatus Aureabacteria bacterium]|nr:radical SAM protein [Candidatus Auribacterota bacterium]
MKKKNYKYIYGPVPSWRLGSSLGIDPLSQSEKVCTFDCTYCQIGKTKSLTDERRIFVPVSDLLDELKSLPPLELDYITFSGTGEPTLALNLGEMIKEVKKIRPEKVAVLTNSTMMSMEDVQKDLFYADFVAAKLDAATQSIFEDINKPMKHIRLEDIIQSIKTFRSCYIGKLALQVMFVEQNKTHAAEIARIVREINADEIQINTPLRPSRVKPLSQKELEKVKSYFKDINVISVYETEKKKVEPVSREETLKRRGKV